MTAAELQQVLVESGYTPVQAAAVAEARRRTL